MSKSNNKKEIRWKKTISLLNNKFLMKQIFFAFLITYIIVTILISTIFLTQGDIKAIPMLLLIFFLVCLSLYILSIFIMLVVFGNRMDLEFTVNDKGVLYEMVDRRGRKLNNFATLFGAITKKPTSTVAGLIAKSQETIFISLKDVIKIEENDKEKVILLKNEWRTLLAIYCNDENYEEVKQYLIDLIKEKVKKTKEIVYKNPIPKYILISLLTILMSITIFTLPYPFEINLFIPILILFFTLGAIWLTRLLFFVTIGGSIYVIFFIIFKMFTKTQSTLFNRTYFRYELISNEDIFYLILLAISIVYFIGLSIYSLKGKFSSMLERDLSN